MYTDRNERAKADKRWQRYAQTLRDDNGQAVMGQWKPLVDELTWLTVQELLNDQTRVTNRTGSTQRKHLGSSLYLCGICDKPITAHSRGYRSDEGGHVMRSRPNVDNWVLAVIRERLSRPNLRDVIPSRDEPRLAAIQAEITERQGKIKRATHDYDEEIIEGYDLKRVRDRENAAIAELEAERRTLTASTDLGGVLDAKDPVKAFDDAELAIKRRIIDFFCTARLYPAPRGRKTFDPETVKLTPK